MESFKLFDKDEDGFLTRYECKCLLLSDGFTDMDYIDDLLDKIDHGDGLISCQSYANLLLS